MMGRRQTITSGIASPLTAAVLVETCQYSYRTRCIMSSARADMTSGLRDAESDQAPRGPPSSSFNRRAHAGEDMHVHLAVQSLYQGVFTVISYFTYVFPFSNIAVAV